MYSKSPSSGPRRSGSKPFNRRARPPRAGGAYSPARPAGGGYAARPAYGSPRPSSGGFGGPRRSFSSGPRRSFGGGHSQGAPRAGSRAGRFGKYIDPNKFINKAVITETTEKFVPEHAFADFKVEPELKANIIAKGYVTPTPIQDRAIPHVLQGADVVGIANTGTGKTAAFAIPLLNRIVQNKDEQVIIMVPTRELALQIADECKGFAKGLGIFGAVFVGGTSVYKDVQKLKNHHHVIIGTPGRLKDLVERGSLKLGAITAVVLDEADRMLDMGFIHDMKYFMSKMPAERQTLFFSATLSREIEALVKDFLKNPVTISVKTQETSASIDQDVVRVTPGDNKIDVLYNLLTQPDFDKVLVFGQTKHGVEKLAKDLVKMGIKADSIHGNKTHGKRQNALRLFKDSHMQVLVATDVAARGLDIAGVSHVINFDIPATYEDYVHRIGRTGRAGKKGKALTFVQERAAAPRRY